MALTALRGKRIVKPKKARAGSRSYDEKYLGTEPMPTGDPEKDILEMKRAGNWYNYMYNSKEGVTKFVYPFFAKDKATLKLLKALPEWRIGITFAGLCRLKTNGFTLRESSQEWFDNRLKEIKAEGAAALKEKSKEQVVESRKPVVTIQDRTKAIIDDHISELEGVLDEYYLSNYKMEFSCYDWLTKNSVKPGNVGPIIQWYTPVLEEIRELNEGKDEQLNEGYSNLTKKQQKDYLKWLETLVSDLKRYADNTKKVRKARVKKPPSIEKQIKSLKYLDKSDEYKLASINPADIIGAQALWVFDTSNRELAVYRAITPGPGLVIKGTTITEWSEGASTKKKLRKPDETLQELLKAGKRQLPKFMDELTTRGSRPKDRINKNMILLRIES